MFLSVANSLCGRYTIRDTGMETYLLVEMHEGGFELLLDVSSAKVVGELVVRQRHALRVLRLRKVCLGSVGHLIERHGLVLDVLNLVKVNVRDLFVGYNRRVMRRRVARELGEVL